MGYFHNNTADNNVFPCRIPIYLKKKIDDLATFRARHDLHTHAHTRHRCWRHTHYIKYTFNGRQAKRHMHTDKSFAKQSGGLKVDNHVHFVA